MAELVQGHLARGVQDGARGEQCLEDAAVQHVPVSGLGARTWEGHSRAVWVFEGCKTRQYSTYLYAGRGRGSRLWEGHWRGCLVASKRLGALPRIKRGALGRGCARKGSGALPLPRAAAVSTGLRVPFPRYAHVGLAAAPPASGALALALL